MKRLLFHVCDFKVNFLNPEKYPTKAICLSEDTFVGAIGQYLYIFEYETLDKYYNIEVIPSGGQYCFIKKREKEYSFVSDSLGKEFRIYNSIDVNKHALGITKNFNVLKGILKKYAMDRVEEENFNFINNNKRINYEARTI